MTPSSPAISADGTYVAFSSTAVNLVIGASLPPCIDKCPPQIYRYNRVDGTIVLVSRVPASCSPQIIGSDLGATQPAISSDGSQIAFVTRSTNLLTTRPSGRRRLRPTATSWSATSTSPRSTERRC